MKKGRLVLLLALLVILFSSAVPRPVAAGGRLPEPKADLGDAQGVEDFFDGLAAAQLAAYPVAGMTIAVVKDGELLFAKGYGLADVEQGRPVVAEQTLFRAGSVSKLLVWTAMMQLVEAGALDLDADVNRYLDFEIPEAFGQPITLRNLMTHTAGFEDEGLGLFLATEDELVPLGQYLAENVPARVFPPGEISAYSNYGATVAAYIVERVAGVPFYEYAEEHILEPLGMTRSTFRQPVPPELAGDLSRGYLAGAGRFEEGIFEFVQPYPVGGLSTTATDMGRFMMAHLQNGRLGESRILQEETVRQMHSLAFSHDPRLPGWGAGFSVGERDGQRLVGHGGDTTYFHSELLLLPEANVGLFVSTNSDRGTFARFELVEAFLERYFGEAEQPAGEQPAVEGFAERAATTTGTYYPARMNFTGIEKFLALMRPVQVEVSGEGLLAVSGLLGSEPIFWREQADGLFRPDGGDLPGSLGLLFESEEEGGEAAYLFFEQAAYIRQPFYAAPGFHLPLLGLSVALFGVVLVATPVGAVVRRRYARLAPQAVAVEPAAARLGRWAAWLFALLNLLFLGLFVVIVSDINNVVFGLPPLMQGLLVVPWVSVLLGAVVVGLVVVAWVKGYWGPGQRLFYTLFALVVVGYLWVLWFWNLV